ncbi:MAG: hypothetical protein U5J63_10275 [Fodinibius sp.]|nr:hypothetical protein [Fodinibius sp.]
MEIFRFLGEETSIKQDLKIMSSVHLPPISSCHVGNTRSAA